MRDKRGLSKTKKIIIILLVIAVLFSIATIAINSSVDDFEMINYGNQLSQIIQGQPSGGVSLVIDSKGG